MRRLAQSAAYTVMMKLFDSADHVTAKTGSTVAITISKVGGAFGNPAAGASNATEVSVGWYKFALGAGDTDTLGDLVVRGTASGADAVEQIMQVVSATTGGASNLDAAVSSRSSHSASDVWAVGTRSLTVLDEDSTTLDLDATIRAAVGLASANLDTQLDGLPTTAEVNAEVDTALSDVGLTTTITGRIDAAITSRMATYAQPTGFLAATFPSDPADESLIIATTDALAALIGDVPTNSELTAAIPTANQNADALLDRASAIDGYTPREVLRLQSAVLFGEVSGAATTPNVIRAVDDSKTRLTITVDASGNRSEVVADAT